MSEIKKNWIVFPFHDESVVNLRFINRDKSKPVINKIYKRLDYGSESAFRESIEAGAMLRNRQGYNVYQCLNQINNHFRGKAAADADICCICSLFIDIDRAVDTSSPATDLEIRQAKDLAAELVSFLLGEGWPEPTTVLSGNGFHLFFGLDEAALEPTTENRDIIKRVLNSLAERFDTPYCKIDRLVHNPARLTKMIGTIARKGEESDERPYRMVRLVSEPSVYYYVTNPMMQTLIEKLSPAQNQSASSSRVKESGFNRLFAEETPRKVALLREQLTFIDPSCSYEIWRNVVFAVLSTGWSVAEKLVLEWSEGSVEKFDADALENLVNSFQEGKAGENGPISIGTILYHARKGGWE